MSTTTKRGPTVVGAFEDRVQARAAVSALISSGFTDSEVGFTALNDEGEVTGDLTDDDDDDDDDSYATEGAATGVAAGAGAGALWGLGIVSGMLPAIGPAIAGGTLAAILSSAAAGAAAAGVAGTLVGIGIPKDDAEYYEGELQSGRTIVTVHTRSRADEARQILESFGGHQIRAY